MVILIIITIFILMQRTITPFLTEWINSTTRMPLIIRGARQVGKTWLVRNLAQVSNRVLIELNFEKDSRLASLFASNDPKEILMTIESALGIKIHKDHNLLFLDEIQAAPELIAKFRWFYEELPELPVIAAGSLLEFVLNDHQFSMPVGRIQYLYLEPLSFYEFLQALQKETLVEYLKNFTWEVQIPDYIHQQLMALFKQYLIIGGMPAAVNDWQQNQSLESVAQIQHNLLATYRDDFNKYSKNVDVKILQDIFQSIPTLIGNKFIYSKIHPTAKAAIIKNSLDLLCKARICHKVVHTDANGVPLAAEVNEKFFKILFIDVGLCSTLLKLNLTALNDLTQLKLINIGKIIEQVVGQQLRLLTPFYEDPACYYWQREIKGSEAEVDYIAQINSNIYPIEVKAGSTGSLKSLHLFMAAKKLPAAIRVNADLPSKMLINVKTNTGIPVNYQLLSMPFYLLLQLPDLTSAS